MKRWAELSARTPSLLSRHVGETLCAEKHQSFHVGSKESKRPFIH
jgi:hypothetical protein